MEDVFDKVSPPTSIATHVVFIDTDFRGRHFHSSEDGFALQFERQLLCE
jgi:hypothetical protein